jgi:type 1 fimbria pilin
MIFNLRGGEMSIRKMSLGLGLLVGLAGSCLASAPPGRGVIHFQGAIVEPPCKVTVTGHGLALHGCPRDEHAGGISARSLEPVVTVSSLDSAAAPARLQVNDAKIPRQYRLLDAASKPITSGNYRVTLTYP